MLKRLALLAFAAAAILVVAAPATATGERKCEMRRVPCGDDHRRCFTKTVCAKYGCRRTKTTRCHRPVKVRVDCVKPYQTTCTRRVNKTRHCPKTRTRWVPNGCSRTVRKPYDCRKKVTEDCRKTRRVPYSCPKKVRERCDKRVDGTCERVEHKTCHRQVIRKYPCDKHETREVPCKKRRGDDSDSDSDSDDDDDDDDRRRKCTKRVTVRGTCTRHVSEPYSCRRTVKYPCKKTIRGHCDKTVHRTCYKHETYKGRCERTVHRTCYRHATERYGCKKTEHYNGRCHYTDTEHYRCTRKRTVKNGCTRWVRRPGQCQSHYWDRHCCARRVHKRICPKKYCHKRVCHRLAASPPAGARGYRVRHLTALTSCVGRAGCIVGGAHRHRGDRRAGRLHTCLGCVQNKQQREFQSTAVVVPRVPTRRTVPQRGSRCGGTRGGKKSRTEQVGSRQRQ